MQPDSWSILALCLSKRLHGTGCCESLVDILFTVHFEGGEKAGFPCILFFRQSQQLGSNTHEQRVHKQHQRRSTHLQWLQLSKLMQLHSQSFNSSLKTVKQNTVCIHESQNLVICYLLFICPLGIQYIGQLRFWSAILSFMTFYFINFSSSPPQAVRFPSVTNNPLPTALRVILKSSKRANYSSYCLLELALLHMVHVCWKEPANRVHLSRDFSDWGPTLSCLLLKHNLRPAIR